MSQPFAADLRLVFWELTAKCNLKCKHCRASALDDFMEGELTTEEILRVAGDIRAAGDPILVLSGGEPMMRPDFFTITEHCCRTFSRVALATNGTLMTDDAAQRVAAAGIQRVSVSLDGASAAVHDRFRGLAGSFDAALRGCAAIRKAGMGLQINVSATRFNEHELPALLELAQQLGADAFHLFMLVPVGCGVELADDARLSPERTEEILVWLFQQSVALRGKLHLKSTCAPMYYRIMRQQAKEMSVEMPAGHGGMHAVTRGCLAGSAVCFISRLGEVNPCGYLPVKAGNVREQPFADIWQDAAIFHELRDPELLDGKCGACAFKRVCLGCRARAFAVHGSYLAEEPDCPYQPPPRATTGHPGGAPA